MRSPAGGDLIEGFGELLFQDAVQNLSKCRFVGLCYSINWQVLGLEANLVKLDCRSTWRVQDEGLGMGRVGKLWTPL